MHTQRYFIFDIRTYMPTDTLMCSETSIKRMDAMYTYEVKTMQNTSRLQYEQNCIPMSYKYNSQV